MALMAWAIWLFFPPAALSILLLAIPWPHFIAVRVRALLRSTFYGAFHLQTAGIKFKLRLAHLLFIGCLIGLYFSYSSATTAAHRYHEHRDQGSGLHTLLLKKFVAERNVWIWAFATTLYLISFQLWVLFAKFVQLAEEGIIAKAGADADKARAKAE
ncbi:hypothetical protein FNF27_00128 [Cafeteria roenbergensis]|uniref:BAP29/BAP31 transmembrane domain-containing protein n=1 Tax=Cafeteria roenbergensis TaxID=33653 RepID=A0A5A8DFZ7_CAFRO|nr:hypothetical protein FNF29_03419 [Cafeteria roenbergensis]KAA0164242.1 hypothetical protein FNF31_02478 [Cafeteria roenbergensis]KAA0178275.1 hypothetical protein FNF27_00128 [Cafeteria roenbergensis]|eukprot:KAA0152895.1 hypothetical protein FNF29_03419 [Cafeteria roenbergensis]